MKSDAKRPRGERKEDRGKYKNGRTNFTQPHMSLHGGVPNKRWRKSIKTKK